MNYKKLKKQFDEKYGDYKKPKTINKLIVNIYFQILEILKKQSNALWKGNFSLADKYDRFFHARCLRIEELKRRLYGLR